MNRQTLAVGSRSGWVRAAFFMALVTCVTTVACRERPVSTAPNRVMITASNALAGSLQPTATDAAEQMYKQIAIRAPAFGGFYVDAAGDPTVVLLDLTALDAVHAVMSQVFGPKFDPQFSGHTWRAVLGQFRYLDLGNWRDTLEQHLFSVFAVKSLYIDQRSNRVIVGLSDSTALVQVQGMISSLGVPLSAVAVTTGPRTRRTATLLDKGRPLPGGYWVEFNAGSCTLGVNASPWSNPAPRTYYFLTAGHCTSGTQGVNNYENYFQPHVGPDSIGREYLTTPVVYNSTDCTTGCLDADALLGKYSLPESQIKFGYLPTMVGLPSADYQRGTFNVDTASFQSIDNVEGYAGAPPVGQGQALLRLGTATGYTRGVVSATCFNGRDDVSGLLYRCEVWVQYSIADEGDSGGPVFANAELFGIEVAKETWSDGSPAGYLYTPMHKIYSAFGFDPNSDILFCYC